MLLDTYLELVALSRHDQGCSVIQILQILNDQLLTRRVTLENRHGLQLISVKPSKLLLKVSISFTLLIFMIVNDLATRFTHAAERLDRVAMIFYYLSR